MWACNYAGVCDYFSACFKCMLLNKQLCSCRMFQHHIHELYHTYIHTFLTWIRLQTDLQLSSVPSSQTRRPPTNDSKPDQAVRRVCVCVLVMYIVACMHVSRQQKHSNITRQMNVHRTRTQKASQAQIYVEWKYRNELQHVCHVACSLSGTIRIRRFWMFTIINRINSSWTTYLNSGKISNTYTVVLWIYHRGHTDHNSYDEIACTWV